MGDGVGHWRVGALGDHDGVVRPGGLRGGAEGGDGVFFRDADEEKDPIAARSGGPKRDEFEHSFLGVETGVEECDPATHQGGEGLMPIGGGGGFVVGDGCEHAIGRDADGLGETEATDVVGFRRTGGVPTGDSGEGPGMNTAGGDGFFPTVVVPSPRTHHAAWGENEWHTGRAGGMVGVMKCAQPSRVVMQDFIVTGAEVTVEADGAGKGGGPVAGVYPHRQLC